MVKKNKIKIKLNGKVITIDKGTNLDFLVKKFKFWTPILVQSHK